MRPLARSVCARLVVKHGVREAPNTSAEKRDDHRKAAPSGRSTRRYPRQVRRRDSKQQIDSKLGEEESEHGPADGEHDALGQHLPDERFACRRVPREPRARDRAPRRGPATDWATLAHAISSTNITAPISASTAGSNVLDDVGSPSAGRARPQFAALRIGTFSCSKVGRQLIHRVLRGGVAEPDGLRRPINRRKTLSRPPGAVDVAAQSMRKTRSRASGSVVLPFPGLEYEVQTPGSGDALQWWPCTLPI